MGDGDGIKQAADLVIRWGNMEKLFEDIETVGKQAADVESYAKDQVFCQSGFKYDLCALKPLSDVMETCQGVFADLRTTFDEHWEGLVAALAVTAKEVADTDNVQETAYLDAYVKLAGEG